MINKIKSPYSLEIIFSYINENKKLNILMYSKKLLLKLQLNIQNYKYFNGIKIIDKYRMKEYFYGQLIYDGEYKNNERNGKGKEYYNGKIIYDGEYKNNERNGKGKEYNRKGDIYFEGKYFNGKRGKGIYYKENFELLLLNIKILNGKNVKIYAHYNGTIMDLKNIIFEREGNPPDDFFLIFKNKRLIDDKLISDYNIQNESNIHEILRYSTKGG